MIEMYLAELGSETVGYLNCLCNSFMLITSKRHLVRVTLKNQVQGSLGGESPRLPSSNLIVDNPLSCKANQRKNALNHSL